MSSSAIDFSKYTSAPTIDFSSYAGPAETKEVAPAPAEPGQISQFVSHAWQQINPYSGAKGFYQLVFHPIDTFEADASQRQQALDQAVSDFKSGKLSRLAAAPIELLDASIPFLGPQNEKIGQEVSAGKYGAALGDVAGISANMIAPELAKRVYVQAPNMQGPAERMYRSSLKPSTAADQSRVSGAIQTGLENRIPVSKGGVEKLSDLMDDVNNKISQQIASSPNAPINKFSVASRLSETAKKFSTQVNPLSDLNAISESGNEFLEGQPVNINAADAQALKQGTYQQMRGKYGQLSAASVEAQKALARGLKEEIAKQFPEINSLNAQDSKLINLDGLLDRAVARISNHQMIGIGTPLATAGAKAISGSNAVAGVSGLLKAVIDDPVIKSHLAIALSHASGGKISLPVGLARVAAYSDALGNASNATNQSNQ